MDVHIPNAGIFSMGAKSIIVAAGVVHVVVGAEVATSEAGAAPKVHCIIAPVTTSCAITMTLLSLIKEFQSKFSAKILRKANSETSRCAYAALSTGLTDSRKV
jgi:hypothetical protein